MKLYKVKRISENICEIIYVSGIFKTHKSAKVYKYSFDWRFIETGKLLPYSLGISLTVIEQELEIGDIFYVECL